MLKVIDNLDGYDSSDDVLLGGEEYSNTIANEIGLRIPSKYRKIRSRKTTYLDTFQQWVG